MHDDATSAPRDYADWVAALPEWGNLCGAKREFEHGPEIDRVRGVLGRLDAGAITALARHWRSLSAEREATVAAWRDLCGAWNRDMNSSPGMWGWEDEAYEPTVRVIEAIGGVLARAGAVGMSLPDPATVRAFARAFELATHGNVAGHGSPRPAVADFAGSLEAGPDAWPAALACAAAVSVADPLVRPAVFGGCLSALLAIDPCGAGPAVLDTLPST